MSDSVRKVHYYSTTVSNRPGEAFRVLSTLVSAGINLLACAGHSTGRRSRIDVVPDDERRFSAAAKKARLLFSQKKAGFLIQGDDRPGALADNMKQLADHGINVASVEGVTAGKGRWGAIVWVDPKDLARAGKVLRAKAEEG